MIGERADYHHLNIQNFTLMVRRESFSVCRVWTHSEKQKGYHNQTYHDTAWDFEKDHLRWMRSDREEVLLLTGSVVANVEWNGIPMIPYNSSSRTVKYNQKYWK